MTDTYSTPNPPHAGAASASASPRAAARHSTERVLWWVAFGVLTFSAVAMLGLWN